MNREMAVEFIPRVETAFALLRDWSAGLLSRFEQAELRTALQPLGQPIMELDPGVLEVIYRAQPDLRPEGRAPVTPLGAGCAWRGPKRDVGGAGSNEDGKAWPSAGGSCFADQLVLAFPAPLLYTHIQLFS